MSGDSAQGVRQYNLWDGAITVQMPESLIPLSDSLQSPDNQEVFSDPTSRTHIIFELLDRVAPSAIEPATASLLPTSTDPDALALLHHLSDLASTDTIALLAPPTRTARAWTLLALTRPVAAETQRTVLALALHRFVAADGGVECDVLCGASVRLDPDEEGEGGARVAAAVRIRDLVAGSVRVVDEGLFA